MYLHFSNGHVAIVMKNMDSFHQNFIIIITNNNLVLILLDLVQPFPQWLSKTSTIISTVVPCIWILSKLFTPTDAQGNCFKRSIKIYIKTAPTCFGIITIIRERTI